MIDPASLKAKLGLDVFKPGGRPHIRIKTGREQDPRLAMAVRMCPAGLYTMAEDGVVTLTIDGCLECGTCRYVCGNDVLEWTYPEGGTGVQFRFG
ncbi:MAG: 4Fe-4S dicluster domain-containing protein [Syntrophales bacterium]|nr:4Fe-4S dicluster domain-containing protein [Syntrophales bacterium]MCK9528384.1 4Fe-4S dicluster domain-containing protein [Syntrophales bacterium]MDX9922691.1 4Fe-4S dicluster domain-containing protein [Syntrophales bacterium]